MITSVPCLVSVRPSGSTLSGANGWPVASRKRRHGDDLDGGNARGDVYSQRVEANIGLIVGERVEDMPSLVVRDAGQPADLRILEARSGRNDLLAEELQLQTAVVVAVTMAVAGASGSRRRRREGERDEQQPRKLCQSECHFAHLPSSLSQQIDREDDRQHDDDQGGNRDLHAAQDEPRRALALPRSASAASSSVFSIGSGMPPGYPVPLGSNRARHAYFTGNEEADRLIAEDPLALLIGFVLDQQVTVPTAFVGPLKLKQRLGRLDAAEIASIDPDKPAGVFREKPGDSSLSGKHGQAHPGACAPSSPRSTTAMHSRVWRDATDTDDLKRRIEELPGFGEMKVKALASVLARRYGNAMAEPLVPSHPMLGDVDSPEALAEYQAAKRAFKASLRAAKA